MLGRLLGLLDKPETSREGKVNIYHHLCLNIRSGRNLCRACEEACPVKALQLEGTVINIDNCVSCGLCAVACPTGVLDELWPALGKVLTVSKDPRPKLWITCQQAPEIRDALRINCLGELTPELVLFLLKRNIGSISVLYNPASCEQCDLRSGQGSWSKVLHQLSNIYPPESGRFEVHQEMPGPVKNERTTVDFSRRTLLRSFSSEAQQLAVQFLLGEKNNPDQPRLAQGLSTRRKLFIYVLSQLRPEQVETLEPGYLRHPEINQECTWCGSCSTLCPSGALRMEALEDGSKNLTINPIECNLCALCASICPISAITVDWEAGNDGPAQRQILLKGRKVTCHQCKSVFWTAVASSNSLCPECSYRHSKPKITWQEI